MENFSDSKLEQRAVIKFLTNEQVPATEIHDRLQKQYGDDVLSYRAVTYWASQFRRGRVSVRDDERSGRPVDVTTEENVAKVEKLVMENRRVKISELQEETGLSYGTVSHVLHDQLHLSKVCARWVPRMLTVFDKEIRVDTSKEILSYFEEDEEGFIGSLVTGDETFVHHYDPESKEESKQWKHSGSPTPIKFRSTPSAGKILATIFWDCEGVLMIDYLSHRATITGDYYANLLVKLREEIKKKRRGKISKRIRLLHDNAAPHRSKVALTAIKDCGFELLSHPPYSPDLAPSDYFLFPDLKKHLRGQRFANDSDVMFAVNEYFASCSKSYFFNGLKCLKERVMKCVKLNGNYVEK